MTGPQIVVMGVSGSGKSTIGALLAERLGAPFIDGDGLHPPRNVAIMSAGHPLTDADREPWLEAVGGALAGAGAEGLVIACSALKRSYRETILRGAPAARFVELDGTPALLHARMAARRGHFMPVSLLDDQLATLEPLASDEPGVRVDVGPDPDRVAATAAAALV